MVGKEAQIGGSDKGCANKLEVMESSKYKQPLTFVDGPIAKTK